MDPELWEHSRMDTQGQGDSNSETRTSRVSGKAAGASRLEGAGTLVLYYSLLPPKPLPMYRAKSDVLKCYDRRGKL
ncbi:hypothetical protein P7K49_007618 [Saguinus oedipus]|uniref:Uncharacterized protein n=1 Tax=Saguinus oedipus TaxID=9490 RepID=A0ABQ9VVL3_SAGOE|nr:hypothetical protein P7K49_007618 [Saguinus oedipus]